MTSQIIAKDALITSSKKTRKPAASSMVVGKDILELISGGMYVDPMAMFREYIQNAVDSIDETKKERKYIASNAQIRLVIDRDNRSVVIRDNGIGVKSGNFERSMLSVGASQKTDTDARGFRGVGRFAGLSYCRELIFRTSYSGENTISEIKWDGVQFKRLVRDRGYKGDLKSFLKEISVASFDESALKTDHFFEVELRGVVRHRNDTLLNEEEIYNYLSQHAPVPFKPDFKFAIEIEKYLTKNGIYSAYKIIVEDAGEERTVYRPYKNHFDLSESTRDKFQEIEFVEIEGMHGETSAVGWILHHSYLGVIPASELIRGLRVREGNIQIGQSNILTDAFPQPRFNSWSVGELHVVSRQLTPTGRRDDFEVNMRYADFINKIASYGRQIAKICHKKSSTRNKIKVFELEEEKVRVNFGIMAQGAVSKRFKEELEKTNFVSLDKMNEVTNSEELNPDTRDLLRERINALCGPSTDIETFGHSEDPLNKYTLQKRKIYGSIFDLIYECTPNQVAAQRLVDKILVRLP